MVKLHVFQVRRLDVKTVCVMPNKILKRITYIFVNIAGETFGAAS